MSDGLTVRGILDAIERLRAEGHKPLALDGPVFLLPTPAPGMKWEVVQKDGEIYAREVPK